MARRFLTTAFIKFRQYPGIPPTSSTWFPIVACYLRQLLNTCNVRGFSTGRKLSIELSLILFWINTAGICHSFILAGQQICSFISHAIYRSLNYSDVLKDKHVRRYWNQVNIFPIKARWGEKLNFVKDLVWVYIFNQTERRQENRAGS